MRSILISSAAALLAITAPIMGRASDNDSSNRFYGGLNLGASRVQNSDDNGSVFKLYGGYQISENFGIEGGFIRLGNLTRDEQTAKARAFYTAGTIRWDFTNAFSVNGSFGVAYKQIDSDKTVGDRNLNGNEAALIMGLGAQYRLSPRTALTMNFDHLADVTEEGASSDVLTAGFVMRF
jgi:OOP family OmpA-OmpF porin